MKTIMLLCVALFSAVQSTPDWYWRPFDGTIPTDALIAVEDDSNGTLFIGNVPVWGGGLFIGSLRSGIREITVTGDGGNDDETKIHTRTEWIQILCTRDPELFEWVATDSSSLNDITDILVEGGYENEIIGKLNIGRIWYNGRYVIGKICSYPEASEGQNRFYFADDEGGETRSSAYEVLVYKGIKKYVKNAFQKIN